MPLCVIRGIFNHAIESGLVDSNPAARLGRFTRTAKTPDTKGVALTPAEVKSFLDAAKAVNPDYYLVFLTALRAGLRRGELVPLQWGDIQFGSDENDSNRFMIVQHNYVRREHTTSKSKKSRRVDLSRDLRRGLIELRDKRLLEAFLNGKNDISEELVFRSPEGTIVDPDNLYHRFFLPVLAKAGIRKIRLHDLRHTFGSLLIQSGAPIVYVKEQMGHSSIQVTVDIYGHLIPGANVSFIDKLDEMPVEEAETTPHQSAPGAHQGENELDGEIAQVADLIGGGGRTRTYDLRIMRPSL
jgi:integrase